MTLTDEIREMGMYDFNNGVHEQIADKIDGEYNALLALIPHVDHHYQCGIRVGGKCDCGLDDALAALPERSK